MGSRAGVDGAFEPHAAASSAQQAMREAEAAERHGSHGRTDGVEDVRTTEPRARGLTLDSPVGAIDRQLAARRVGLRTKGPPASEVLAEQGIETVRDLLHHYPRRYIDRSQVSRIGELKIGTYATVIARVKRVTKRQTRRRQSMVTITLYDGSGYLDLTFFNQPWTGSMYKEGYEVAVSGIAQLYRGRLQLANQEIELLKGDDQDLVHTGRITPVHRATEGITTRTIRELVWRALERLGPIPDPMPEDLIRAESLPPFDRAIRDIHFPGSQPELAAAIERLKFDELFVLELGLAFRKHRVERAEIGVAHEPDGPLLERLDRTLPFEPTAAQRRANGRDRRGDGAPAADERPVAGRRRLGQDARRGARGPRRDRLGSPGRDHGAHRGARGTAFPPGRGAPRRLGGGPVPGARVRARAPTARRSRCWIPVPKRRKVRRA